MQYMLINFYKIYACEFIRLIILQQVKLINQSKVKYHIIFNWKLLFLSNNNQMDISRGVN